MKIRSLLLTVVSSLLTLTAATADNLGEILEKAELGALIGTWVDEDSNGEAITVSYTWRLKGHALAMSVKTPNRSSEALLGVDPKSGAVVHASVDDKGGVGHGSWAEEDGVATLTLKVVNAEKKETKLKVTQKIVDNKKLVIGFKNAETDEGGEVILVRKAE